MSITPKWDEKYSPAAATRSSWVPLDMSTITDYPSSGSGKMAQLVYQVNSSPISLTAGDMTIEPNYPNTTIYESLTVSATSIQTINFAETITLLEIYNNNETAPIYLTFNVGAMHGIEGLPITPESYYSIERETETIYLANPSNEEIDVRVIAHYRNV